MDCVPRLFLMSRVEYDQHCRISFYFPRRSLDSAREWKL